MDEELVRCAFTRHDLVLHVTIDTYGKCQKEESHCVIGCVTHSLCNDFSSAAVDEGFLNEKE